MFSIARCLAQGLTKRAPSNLLLNSLWRRTAGHPKTQQFHAGASRLRHALGPRLPSPYGQWLSWRPQSTKPKTAAKNTQIMSGVAVGCVLTTLTYLGRPDDADEVGEAVAHRYVNDVLPLQYYKRARDRLTVFYKYYADPIDEMLLPDPLPEAQQPPTLVLEYNQVLTYSEWTPENGYRVRVRKGAREFLRYLAQFYELVIYTSVSAQTADPILAGLQGDVPVIFGALYRESTRYQNGIHIKDLTCLNRDLKKVVMVDTDPTHYSLAPDNGICLPPWKGNPEDTALIDLLPFFVMLATSNLDDVRPVLSYYQGKDVVETYKENQRRIREADEARSGVVQQQMREARKGGLRLFRGIATVPSDAAGQPAQAPPMGAENMVQPTHTARGESTDGTTEEQKTTSWWGGWWK